MAGDSDARANRRTTVCFVEDPTNRVWNDDDGNTFCRVLCGRLESEFNVGAPGMTVSGRRPKLVCRACWSVWKRLKTAPVGRTTPSQAAGMSVRSSKFDDIPFVGAKRELLTGERQVWDGVNWSCESGTSTTFDRWVEMKRREAAEAIARGEKPQAYERKPFK